MKFSPTTILGYLQVVATGAIIGKPLYLYWTVETYDSLAGLAAASAVTLAVNAIFAAVKGHFTADNPPSPKAND